MTLETLFTDIADAIRSKTGETAAIKAADFPSVIAGIQSGEDWSFGTAKSGYGVRSLQSDLLIGADEFFVTVYEQLSPGSRTASPVVTASKIAGQDVGVFVINHGTTNWLYVQGSNYVTFDATTGTISLQSGLDSYYLFYAVYNVAIRKK